MSLGHSNAISTMPLHFQTMSVTLLAGGYLQIPVAPHLCICGVSVAENLLHYALFCPMYTEARAKFLANLLVGHNFSSDTNKLDFLLCDTAPFVTYRVFMFLLDAKKKKRVRAKTVSSENNFPHN